MSKKLKLDYIKKLSIFFKKLKMLENERYIIVIKIKKYEKQNYTIEKQIIKLVNLVDKFINNFEKERKTIKEENKKKFQEKIDIFFNQIDEKIKEKWLLYSLIDKENKKIFYLSLQISKLTAKINYIAKHYWNWKK